MNTKYGFLNGLEDNELYPNGTLKLCRVTEANILETKLHFRFVCKNTCIQISWIPID